MMTKLLSCMLSLTILLTSILPTYAQAVNSSSRNPIPPIEVIEKPQIPIAVSDQTNPANWDPNHASRMIEVRLAQEQVDTANIEQTLLPILTAFKEEKTTETATTDPTSIFVYDDEVIEELEKEYLAELEKLEKESLRKAKNAEEIRYIKEHFAKLRTDDEINIALMKMDAEFIKHQNEHPEIYEQYAREATEEYLKTIIPGALSILNRSKIAQELVPLLAASGFLNEEQKAVAATHFRNRLKATSASCGQLSAWSGIKILIGFDGDVKDAQLRCEQALEAASSLGVLGSYDVYSIDKQEDGEALRQFLLDGYNGIASPMVVQVASQSLLALNAETELTTALLKIMDTNSYSPIDVSLELFSVRGWVEFEYALAHSKDGFQGATFTDRMEYSFYDNPEKQYANKRNIWIDLGEALAEMADDPKEPRRKHIQQILSVVVERAVSPDSNGIPGFRFRPFVVGAMSGGYQVQLSQPTPGLNKQGKMAYPSTKGWTKLRNIIAQTGFSPTEYLTYYYYSLNKIDLDRSTAQYVDNWLVMGHTRAAKKNGRTIPSKTIGDDTYYTIGYRDDGSPVQMVSSTTLSDRYDSTLNTLAYYKREWDKMKGTIADVVLIVFAFWKVGGMVLKWGADAIKTGTRLVRLARMGQIATKTGFFSNLSKVVARARTINGLPPYKTSLAATVSDIVGLERVKIMDDLAALRAAKPTKVVPPQIKTPKPQGELRTLNGKQYMVMEGTETAYVNGEVVYVQEGTPLSQIAKEYGVAESQVAWALDGSVAPVVAPKPVNYGAGEAVAGSTGVKPVYLPEGTSAGSVRPATRPLADPSLVKPGEKLAYVFRNGSWEIESVPSNLTRAEIAKKFKVNIDDIDYVSSLSDGTLAPRWAEFDLVWDVAEMPSGLKFTKRDFTKWDLFKFKTYSFWDGFTTNTSQLFSFGIKNPFRTTGMALSSYGLGGIAPVDVFPTMAQVSTVSQASRPFTFSKFLTTASESSLLGGATRTAAAAVPTTTAAQTAGTTSSLWGNMFWYGYAPVTSVRHLTPISALPYTDKNSFRYTPSFTPSKWQTPAAFEKYKQDLSSWLYNKHSLVRKVAPWAAFDAWQDFKSHISLSWQEFRLGMAGNTYYFDFTSSKPSTPAPKPQDGSDESSATVQEDLPQTVLPTENPNRWIKIWNYIRDKGISIANAFRPGDGFPKEDATPKAENTLLVDGERVSYWYQTWIYNPQTGEVKKIKADELVPEGWESVLLADTYSFVPTATDEHRILHNSLAELILRNKQVSVENLTWILTSGAHQAYKIRAYKRFAAIGQKRPSVEAIIKQAVEQKALRSQPLSPEVMLDISNTVQRILNEGGNLSQLLSPEYQVLAGKDSEEALLNINKKKISAALYDAKNFERDFLSQMEVSNTRKNHKKYKNLVPVYLRLKNRQLSAEPRLYIVLSGQQSFTVPRGFVLAMDEKGQMKFVARDSENDIVQSSPYWEWIARYFDKSVKLLNTTFANREHIVFEQPLSIQELAGLSHVLATDTKMEKIGVLQVRQPDTFEKLMNTIALIAGADLGASMSSEFKGAMPLEALAVLISGFGYLSPVLASKFNPLFTKYGYYKTVRAVLFSLLAISALGLSFKIWGNYEYDKATLPSQLASYIFAAGAILGASVLSTIASPIMKGVYTDPTQYASKNMGFTTKKGLSRLIVTLIPLLAGIVIPQWVAPFIFPDSWGVATTLQELKLNWSVLVPIMGGGTIAGFYFLQKSRLATETIESNKKENPITKKEAENIYKKTFKEPLSSTVRRVGLVYLSYGVINSVILGSMMKMLYDPNPEKPTGAALAITAAGLLISYLIRTLADKLIKNKVITDDQLTGIGLPIMTAGILSLLFSPVGSPGMWLGWLAMYLSTPVFGVVENTRMMNRVAQHYTKKREELRQKNSTSKKAKETELKNLNNEESAMKLEAARAYNKANAMGIWGILGLALLSLFLIDFPEQAPALAAEKKFFPEEVSMASMWINEQIAFINQLFGDPTSSVKDLAYSIYRMMFAPSLLASAFLVIDNWKMVKDGWWKRIVKSTALTQEQINNHAEGTLSDQEVFASLQFDPKEADSYKSRINRELEELDKSIRGSMNGALESESRLQALMNRMVWINNRIAALYASNQITAVKELSSYLVQLRILAKMFQQVLANNDVSQALRDQLDDLVRVVNSYRFDQDNLVENLAAQLRKAGEDEATIDNLLGAYYQGDVERFKLYAKDIKNSDKDIEDAISVLSKILKNSTYTLQAFTLNFLPELQRSALGTLFNTYSGKIFNGTNVSLYEKVKVRYLRTLKILLDKKANGQLYDGIGNDFTKYYQKAIAALTQYAQETPNDAERIRAMEAELNKVYSAFYGTEGPSNIDIPTATPLVEPSDAVLDKEPTVIQDTNKPLIPEVSTTHIAKKTGFWKRLGTKTADFFRNRVEERPVTVIDDDKEEVLPITLKIFNRFDNLKVDGFSKVTLIRNPKAKNEYVVHAANGNETPKVMEHFFLKIGFTKVKELLDLFIASKQSGKLHLKLEARPNVTYEADVMPVYSIDGKELPLEVEVPKNSYINGAIIILQEDGSLAMKVPGTTRIIPFEGLYVRLPKSQLGKFVKAVRLATTPFEVEMHPTDFRANLIIGAASITNVSIGKTFAPIVYKQLGITEESAKRLMFGVNYILPGLASLLTPTLKKYGEKKLMLVAMLMSTGAALVATAGGFYGFVEGTTLSLTQKIMFVTALVLMSGSSILKQMVSNMLIKANQGKLILEESAKKDQRQTTVTNQEEEVLPPSSLWKRLKEVFTKKSDTKLKDLILFNLAFVYKNVGTLLFLAFPYMINFVAESLFGVNPHLDYSVSFPIFLVYGTWNTFKMWRSKLRDAYSVKDLQKSTEAMNKAINDAAELLATHNLDKAELDMVARALKEAIEDLTLATIKLNTALDQKETYKQLKEEFLPQLTTKLKGNGLSATAAEELTKKVASSISAQENVLLNLWKMFKAPGVTSLTIAMTAATVHEFMLSSEFASQIKELIQGEFANFLIALTLYLPFIIGRLGGNFINKRISKDSMYMFCSSLSLIGTVLMLAAGNSVPMTIAGAAIASLGVGNFFTQMYDYIMNRYKKQNRELSALLTLTMGIAGFGALVDVSYGFNLSYALGMLIASLVLTTPMMKNSTLVKVLRNYLPKKKDKGAKKQQKSKDDDPENPGNLPGASGNLDDALPAS